MADHDTRDYLYIVDIYVNPKNYPDGNAPLRSTTPCTICVIKTGFDKLDEVKDIIRQKKVDINIFGPWVGWTGFDLSKVSDTDIEISISRKNVFKIIPLNNGVISFYARDG
jgi:hypothetical protein